MSRHERLRKYADLAARTRFDALLLILCLAILLARKMETIWVVVGAGVTAMLTSSLPVFRNL